MLAADQYDVVTLAFAVLRETQSPPRAGRVHHAHLALIVEQTFNDEFCSPTLASTTFPKNGDVLIESCTREDAHAPGYSAGTGTRGVYLALRLLRETELKVEAQSADTGAWFDFSLP